MTYISLYSASIAQTGSSAPTVVSLFGGKSAVTATWLRIATGSYQLSSSGIPNFSGISGSITGSITLTLNYRSSSSLDTASISFYSSGSNTSSLFLAVQSNPLLGIYKDSILFGSCSVDVGITY
jgi:hypothetical protein